MKQYWLDRPWLVRNVPAKASTSKYSPHQGKQEVERRLRKQK